MIRLKIQYISFRFSLFSFILFTEDEMISLLSSCFSGSKYGMTSSIEENTDSSLADFVQVVHQLVQDDFQGFVVGHIDNFLS